MNGILLRLAAPLMSFGEHADFHYHDTLAFPSRSALIGLFAAADGRSRDEARAPDPDTGKSPYSDLTFTVTFAVRGWHMGRRVFPDEGDMNGGLAGARWRGKAEREAVQDFADGVEVWAAENDGFVGDAGTTSRLPAADQSGEGQQGGATPSGRCKCAVCASFTPCLRSNSLCLKAPWGSYVDLFASRGAAPERTGPGSASESEGVTRGSHRAPRSSGESGR
ncbi:CRISPR-associated protein Cas5 [Streptomyces pseudovenezuelae]|uniref:CRISPR-associated protein Cas5 n=1 Tax=Streptomyces pseudovenezuelae TaxID=67350 RepID=UPI0034A3CA5F